MQRRHALFQEALKRTRRKLSEEERVAGDRAHAADKPAIRVLLVEDYPDLRQFLCEILEDSGFEVIAVGSGTEARRQLDENRFSVLLTDIGLPPPEDGFALAERAIAAGIPVAVMTGSQVSVERAEASGLPHLMKPFRPGELIRLVRETASKSRS